jgi:hypothetical protein
MWQDKKVQLPDSRIADGVVAVNPTTGEPYSTATGGLPVSIVGTGGSEYQRINVEPLGVPGVARQLTAGAASANTALTVGVARISMYARNADIRYVVGSTSQTASATSHFIAAGERLDIDVPATPNIAVIRAGTSDGTLEVTELS